MAASLFAIPSLDTTNMNETFFQPDTLAPTPSSDCAISCVSLSDRLLTT